MTNLEVPGIINRLALAGEEGMSLAEIGAGWGDLEKCGAWGFDLKRTADRVSLPLNEDTLIPAWIERETPAIAWESLCVAGYLEIGSTNDEALARARQEIAGGLLIYAERQTAGRGRQGRPWISPARAGLYFTLLLRPDRPLRRWTLLTQVASASIVRALRSLWEEKKIARPLAIDLKWPNDVLLSGLKTAGILIETATGGRRGSAAAIGVGINVGQDSIPENLRDCATAVSVQAGIPIPRRRLLVEFLRQFQALYALFEQGRDKDILAEWKAHSSMWNGMPVRILDSAGVRLGVTCGLTGLGALRIRTPDGAEEVLLAGDVCVRRD